MLETQISILYKFNMSEMISPSPNCTQVPGVLCVISYMLIKCHILCVETSCDCKLNGLMIYPLLTLDFNDDLNCHMENFTDILCMFSIYFWIAHFVKLVAGMYYYVSWYYFSLILSSRLVSDVLAGRKVWPKLRMERTWHFLEVHFKIKYHF